MALDTERTPDAPGFRTTAYPRLSATLARLGARWRIAREAMRPALAQLARFAPHRIISSTLLSRILITNLFGLTIVIGGILYLSAFHTWLVEAKQESLRTQGEIIAAAIASDARIEQGNIELQPEKLTGPEGSRVPYRDDGFASLQLSIMPERVTPVLRRLIQPTKTRARIYGKDGTLIVDSSNLLMRGQLTRPVASNKRVQTKNFWTRLTEWMIGNQLPVYKEIGNARGTAYPGVRDALTGTPTTMLLLNGDGEQIVSMAVPIRKQNTILGVLLLSTRPGDIDAILAEERSLILTVAAIALLATIITSFLLARTVAEPIRRLAEAAEHVSYNINARTELPDYTQRVDEVGQLANAFRSMTAALFRRIEASESFAADVAHELKNPLTAARSTAESLGYAKSEEQRAQLVQQIQNELKRLNRLITDVSNASRLDAELARQQTRPVDVTEVVTGVTRIFRDILSADTRQVAVTIEPAPYAGAFTVSGHDGRIAQVVTNLVDNAISFSPDNGVITVAVKAAGRMVEVSVEDQGPGMPDDRLGIVFDRFYTDRPETEALRGKNSGLGLSISREIVRAHGGEIWAENLTGVDARGEVKARSGARFVVRLPMTGRGGPTIVRRT